MSQQEWKDKLSEDEIVKGEGHDYQTVSDIEKQISDKEIIDPERGFC